MSVIDPFEELPPGPERYLYGPQPDPEESVLAQLAEMYATGEIDLARLEEWTEQALTPSPRIPHHPRPIPDIRSEVTYR